MRINGKLSRLLVVFGALLAIGASMANYAADRVRKVDLSLVVFDRGNPASGLRLAVDGKRLGATDADGALWTSIPAGRHRLILLREDQPLVELDLLTAEGESLLILVTLPDADDAQPRIEITGAATGSRARIVTRDKKPEPSAPPGALTGRIFAVRSHDPIAGAKLYFAGQATDATTDAKGRYQVELPAGAYRLSVIHPDYATQRLDHVRVIPGKLVTADIELSPAGVALADYIVTAPYVEGSVASVFSLQREAEGVVDIIGAEQMARTGDSDAAEALGRVTGLTIEDGGFVVIRGQPERYTYSLFNGSPLPSPDPIQRIVPLDLFPAGVLQSVAVQKSYTPDQPGEFGGGLIELNTREVPEEAFGNVAVKTGFNTNATLQDGLAYDGGDTDFLGFDDGTRAVPDGADSVADIADLPEAQALAVGRTFPNNYQVTEETLPADSGLSAVGGGRFDALGGQLGVLGSFAWERNFRAREQIERTYSASGDDLILADDFVARRTDMNARLSGLVAASGEWGKTSLNSNTFLIQNTTDRAEIIEGVDATSDDDFVRDFLLSWDEQQLLVQQFLGEHDLDVVRLGWRALTAFGSRDAPDRRTYRYTRLDDDGEDFVFVSDPAGVTREYNETDDQIYSLGVDLTVPLFGGKGFTADAKIGASLYDQTRESSTRRFLFTPADTGQLLSSDNPEDFLGPELIGDSVEFTEETLGIDDYTGDILVEGAYLLGDLSWPGVGRLVAGVRREQADFSALSFQGAEGQRDTPGGFETEDVLPAVDATYFLNEDMQVRATWAETVSRPTLNELSPAVYFDPRTGDTFVGNPDLEPAEITSYDLRWEWYPSSIELVTAGVFRKDYTNPIEQVLQPLGESSILNSTDNADEATVSGIELSARSAFATVKQWIGDPRWLGGGWLDKMYFQGNAAFIDSEVTLNDIGVATSQARPLQGQAESILNFQLGYDGEKHDVTVAYNRVGRRLFRPGTQGRPDIFREPVASLDLIYRYQPWLDLTLGLELSNLLNPTLDIKQDDQIFESFEAGVSGTLFLNWGFY